MEKLKNFISILEGRFNNKEQFEEMKKKDVNDYPFAEHTNTVCNDKIINLPDNFKGKFLLEESYYTVGERKNIMPHLFLFTEEGDKIKLTSYEMPEGYDKNTFNYDNLSEIPYESLKVSEKFTPAIYENKDNVWEGGSVSMFTPVLKFTLFERFCTEWLEVDESMEVNGKRTFGYDDPIIYKRI